MPDRTLTEAAKRVAAIGNEHHTTAGEWRGIGAIAKRLGIDLEELVRLARDEGAELVAARRLQGVPDGDPVADAFAGFMQGVFIGAMWRDGQDG